MKKTYSSVAIKEGLLHGLNTMTNSMTGQKVHE